MDPYSDGRLSAQKRHEHQPRHRPINSASGCRVDRGIADERKLDPSAMHHDLGMTIRTDWSLWERDTPLKRDAVTNYGIAHPDDITGLILAWASAVIRAEPFTPLEHYKR